MKRIALLLLLLIAGCTVSNQVCFEEVCFDAEVVNTPETRATGLMFREDLPQDSGMLFVFEQEGNYSFWMKNTLIPLDMIWISENKEVVYIAKDVQPCTDDSCPSINPNTNALYVFEVNAGVTDSEGIFAGDKVSLP